MHDIKEPPMPMFNRVFNVVEFGAVGIGITDDTNAIKSAIAAAAAFTLPRSSGAVVHLPAGTYLTSSQLVLPSQVILRGEGSRSTTLLLADTFPTNTPLIRIGDGTQVVFSSRVEELTLDLASNGAIAGSIGIYSTDCQEQCGASHVVITGYCLGSA